MATQVVSAAKTSNAHAPDCGALAKPYKQRYRKFEEHMETIAETADRIGWTSRLDVMICRHEGAWVLALFDKSSASALVNNERTVLAAELKPIYSWNEYSRDSIEVEHLSEVLGEAAANAASEAYLAEFAGAGRWPWPDGRLYGLRAAKRLLKARAAELVTSKNKLDAVDPETQP